MLVAHLCLASLAKPLEEGFDVRLKALGGYLRRSGRRLHLRRLPFQAWPCSLCRDRFLGDLNLELEKIAVLRLRHEIGINQLRRLVTPAFAEPSLGDGVQKVVGRRGLAFLHIDEPQDRLVLVLIRNFKQEGPDHALGSGKISSRKQAAGLRQGA